MVNQQTLKGNWNELAGQVRKKWGQVSDQELKEVSGDAQRLVGLIQRKTGESRERIESQIDQWFSSDACCEDDHHGGIAETAQEIAASASMQAQAAYEQVADRALEGYEYADQTLRHRPWESVAVALGVGLLAGVFLTTSLRR